MSKDDKSPPSPSMGLPFDPAHLLGMPSLGSHGLPFPPLAHLANPYSLLQPPAFPGLFGGMHNPLHALQHSLAAAVVSQPLPLAATASSSRCHSSSSSSATPTSTPTPSHPTSSSANNNTSTTASTSSTTTSANNSNTNSSSHCQGIGVSGLNPKPPAPETVTADLNFAPPPPLGLNFLVGGLGAGCGLLASGGALAPLGPLPGLENPKSSIGLLLASPINFAKPPSYYGLPGHTGELGSQSASSPTSAHKGSKSSSSSSSRRSSSATPTTTSSSSLSQKQSSSSKSSSSSMASSSAMAQSLANIPPSYLPWALNGASYPFPTPSVSTTETKTSSSSSSRRSRRSSSSMNDTSSSRSKIPPAHQHPTSSSSSSLSAGASLSIPKAHSSTSSSSLREADLKSNSINSSSGGGGGGSSLDSSAHAMAALAGVEGYPFDPRSLISPYHMSPELAYLSQSLFLHRPDLGLPSHFFAASAAAAAAAAASSSGAGESTSPASSGLEPGQLVSQSSKGHGKSKSSSSSTPTSMEERSRQERRSRNKHESVDSHSSRSHRGESRHDSDLNSETDADRLMIDPNALSHFMDDDRKKRLAEQIRRRVGMEDNMADILSRHGIKHSDWLETNLKEGGRSSGGSGRDDRDRLGGSSRYGDDWERSQRASSREAEASKSTLVAELERQEEQLRRLQERYAIGKERSTDEAGPSRSELEELRTHSSASENFDRDSHSGSDSRSSTPDGVKRSADGSNDEGSPNKRRCMQLDERELTIPLEHGWNRQTIINGMGRRGIVGEVLYFAPCGKKMKTIPDVLRYLERNPNPDLGRENFSFNTKVNVGHFYETRGGTETPVPMTDTEVLERIEMSRGKRARMQMLARKKREKAAREQALARQVMEEKLKRRVELQELARRAAESRFEKRLELQKQKEKEKKERENKVLEKKKEKEQSKMMKQQEKIRAQEQIRKEREMRAQQIIEARNRRQQELEELRLQDAMKRNKEREMKRQQLIIMKEQERERRRQHLILIKALEQRKKQEDKQNKERMREEKLHEKIRLREIRMQQRRVELEVAQELKKPVDDMELKVTKPLPVFPRMKSRLAGRPIADCLMVVEFLSNFGLALNLDKSSLPTMDSLEKGLMGDSEEDVEELMALVMHLLRFALDDVGVPNPKEAVTRLNQKITEMEMTDSTMSEILRIFVKARGEKEMSEWLTNKPMEALNATKKAALLAFLCNELLNSKVVIGEIDKHMDAINNLRRDKWIVEGQLRQLRVFQARKFNKIHKSSDRRPVGNSHTIPPPNSNDEDTMSSSKMGSDEEEEKEEEEEEKDEDSGNDSDGASSVMTTSSVSSNMPFEPVDESMSRDESDKKIDKLRKQHAAYRQKVFQASLRLRAVNIGQDRYKRTYWALPLTGGLYIEGMESGVPEDYVKENMKKEKKEESDGQKEEEQEKELKKEEGEEQQDMEVDVKTEDGEKKEGVVKKEIKEEEEETKEGTSTRVKKEGENVKMEKEMVESVINKKENQVAKESLCGKSDSIIKKEDSMKESMNKIQAEGKETLSHSKLDLDEDEASNSFYDTDVQDNSMMSEGDSKLDTSYDEDPMDTSMNDDDDDILDEDNETNHVEEDTDSGEISKSNILEESSLTFDSTMDSVQEDKSMKDEEKILNGNGLDLTAPESANSSVAKTNSGISSNVQDGKKTGSEKVGSENNDQVSQKNASVNNKVCDSQTVNGVDSSVGASAATLAPLTNGQRKEVDDMSEKISDLKEKTRISEPQENSVSKSEKEQADESNAISKPASDGAGDHTVHRNGDLTSKKEKKETQSADVGLNLALNGEGAKPINGLSEKKVAPVNGGSNPPPSDGSVTDLSTQKEANFTSPVDNSLTNKSDKPDKEEGGSEKETKETEKEKEDTGKDEESTGDILRVPKIGHRETLVSLLNHSIQQAYLEGSQDEEEEEENDTKTKAENKKSSSSTLSSIQSSAAGDKSLSSSSSSSPSSSLASSILSSSLLFSAIPRLPSTTQGKDSSTMSSPILSTPSVSGSALDFTKSRNKKSKTDKDTNSATLLSSAPIPAHSKPVNPQPLPPFHPSAQVDLSLHKTPPAAHSTHTKTQKPLPSNLPAHHPPHQSHVGQSPFIPGVPHTPYGLASASETLSSLASIVTPPPAHSHPPITTTAVSSAKNILSPSTRPPTVSSSASSTHIKAPTIDAILKADTMFSSSELLQQAASQVLRSAESQHQHFGEDSLSKHKSSSSITTPTASPLKNSVTSSEVQTSGYSPSSFLSDHLSHVSGEVVDHKLWFSVLPKTPCDNKSIPLPVKGDKKPLPLPSLPSVSSSSSHLMSASSSLSVLSQYLASPSGAASLETLLPLLSSNPDLLNQEPTLLASLQLLSQQPPNSPSAATGLSDLSGDFKVPLAPDSVMTDPWAVLRAAQGEAQPIPQDKQHGWWRIYDIAQFKAIMPATLNRGIREKNLQRAVHRYTDYAGTHCTYDSEKGETDPNAEPPKDSSQGATPTTADKKTKKAEQKNQKTNDTNPPTSKSKTASTSDKAPDADTDEDKTGYGDPTDTNDADKQPCDSEAEAEPEKDFVTPDDPSLWSIKAMHDIEVAALEEVGALEERIFHASLQAKQGWKPQKDNAIKLVDRSVTEVADDESYPLDVAISRLLELEANIERRYLKPPLIRSSSLNISASSSDKTGSGLNEEDVPPGLLLWRQAVVAAESPAQLSLCTQLLSKSISWEKSIMKVTCQLCQKDDNEAELLLCDGCDKGYHTYCFKPKMENIPEGDWFCFECVSKASGTPHCVVCGNKGGKMVSCSKCPRYTHLDCLEPALPRTPKRWQCATCLSDKSNSKRSRKRKESLPTVQRISVTRLVIKEEPRDVDDMEVSHDGTGDLSIDLHRNTPTPSKTSASSKAATAPTTSTPVSGSPEKKKRKRKAKEKAPDETLLETVASPVVVIEPTPSPRKRERKEKTPKEPKEPKETKRKSREKKGEKVEVKVEVKEEKKEEVDEEEEGEMEERTREQKAKDMLACGKLLTELEKNENGWPFLKPVNRKQFPSYKKYIKTPMDFSTAKAKLRNKEYRHRQDFAGDMRLIFNNCETFNEDESDVGQAGFKMRQFFENRWLEIFPDDAN